MEPFAENKINSYVKKKPAWSTESLSVEFIILIIHLVLSPSNTTLMQIIP